jgi:hypothetical protein
MSTPEPDEVREKMIASAVSLAIEMSSEGAKSLSAFLGAVDGPMQAAASQQLRNLPSRDMSKKGGQLASEVATVALDVAEAAREGFAADPRTRNRTVDLMSDVVSFLGSMFIDTANQAVGASAGQPATNRARLVTVPVSPGGKAKASIWVVNRGVTEVTDALVEIARKAGQPEITPRPEQVTIPAGGRARIDLDIEHTPTSPESFSDVLLFIRGVGSIVVRTVVSKDPPPPGSPA